ncbi:MAG TPA: circadian clock KaiB family protein [Desulfotignum sp.]|nr:circadian clock KaiB family protein [Desulfotignum sp.]
MSANTFSGNFKDKQYKFILFVAGDEPNSMMARQNLADLCEQELKGRSQIKIVDVMEDFDSAEAHNILLTPTLLVQNSSPDIMVIGNLNNRKKVRAALHLPLE